MLKYGRQLGDIVIAPKYVLEQCAADQRAYEVRFPDHTLTVLPPC
jgi:ssRNA-specific RNase YbeY (16S rRNA maturation enzyme)